MARLRNFVRKMVHEVLELCCFEWFQNFTTAVCNLYCVLELCCFEWFQNIVFPAFVVIIVLELCCFEWFQNWAISTKIQSFVLELCCFEWFQNECSNEHDTKPGFRAVLFRMVPKPHTV